jgi:hypothetical protein
MSAVAAAFAESSHGGGIRSSGRPPLDDGEFLASDRWQVEWKRRMLVPNLGFSTS